MTDRAVMDHEEAAAAILNRHWYRLQGKRADYKAHMQAAITEALQSAFDLGFRAAGGTVTPLSDVTGRPLSAAAAAPVDLGKVVALGKLRCPHGNELGNGSFPDCGCT